MANIGRDLTVAIGTASSEVVIAGVRTKSITINNEPVDTTNDDDSGVRKMLAEPGVKAVDVSVEGVVEDDIALALSMSATNIITSCEITYPSGATLAGDFAIASFAESGTNNDAVTFTLELQSADTVTYTAAP